MLTLRVEEKNQKDDDIWRHLSSLQGYYIFSFDIIIYCDREIPMQLIWFLIIERETTGS